MTYAHNDDKIYLVFWFYNLQIILEKLRLEGDRVIVSETEFIARYGETDQMGIIHHSNTPVWFEAGRTDFFKWLELEIK